jgi:pyridoxine kinase
MNTLKHIAVINDLSGVGNCSLTAALPTLAALGVQAHPLPTAVLSGQTGFPGFQLKDLTDQMAPFAAHWQQLDLHFDAIFTGFLASVAQAREIRSFFDTFQQPDTLVLVDPVMGDDGHLYSGFTPDLCRAIADLARRADVVTPNLTEACYLAGENHDALCDGPLETVLDRVYDLAGAVAAQGPQIVAVTGIHRADRFYNVVWDHGQRIVESAPACGGSYSGTGDLFASVLIGCLTRGMATGDAVRLAVRFISAALADTVPYSADRNYGTAFVKHLHLLWEAFS